MSSFSYTLHATIPAPQQRVFDLLTDPTHIPQWLPFCKSVDAPKLLRRKSRIRVNFGARSAELEVVEITPPANFGWIERRGRPGHQVYFHLAFAGGSTTLTMKSIWQAAGLKAWLRGKMSRRRDAKRMFEGLVNNLRQMVTK